MNFIDLQKLIDYKGNRYALTKACNEYAKKVRYLFPNEYGKVKNQDSILALSHLLNNSVLFSLEKPEIDEDDLERDSILFSSKHLQSEAETTNSLAEKSSNQKSESTANQEKQEKEGVSSNEEE